MITEYDRKSFVFGIPGIVLQASFKLGPFIFKGLGFGKENPIPGWVFDCFFVALIAGTLLLFIGLGYYAKSKGYSPAWCLLGFLSIIGFIILGCLPDRTTDKGGAKVRSTNRVSE